MKNERKRVMTILKRLAGVYTPDFELESLHNDDDDICDYVKSGEYGLAGWLCNKKEFLQDVYDLKNSATDLIEQINDDEREMKS